MVCSASRSPKRAEQIKLHKIEMRTNIDEEIDNRMKKVFLISPSLQRDVQARNIDNSYGLGLGYLHSVIELAGYDIKTISYNNVDEYYSIKEVRAHLLEFCPGYLLLNIFTMNRVASYRIINMVRKLQPEITIIVGGVHATVQYKQMLESCPIDYVVLGEGEITIVELLKAMDKKVNTDDIQGIAYCREGRVIKTEDRELVKDLDQLPFPKHELFMNPKRTLACILSSRGCPHKCSFCCLDIISKRKFRARSVANVVEEVEYILNNFKHIKIIQFADDTFAQSIRRAKEFCYEIIRRGIKVEFWTSARFKPTDQELFELMGKAGFTNIGFGLETGSEKLLKSIHKNINQDDVKEVFHQLKNTKLNVGTFLLVGFPGETKETINETIGLLKELKRIIPTYKMSAATLLWIYPGTEVYDIAKEKGMLTDDFWLSDGDVPRYTVEHSYYKLYYMAQKMTNVTSPFRQLAKCLAIFPRDFYRFLVKRYEEVRIKKFLKTICRESE